MKKFNMEEIDDSIIQDLIDHCEDNMASPYKEKAKAKVVVAKMEEPSEDEESSMMMDDEKSSDEDEMSDEDKQKLMELYRSLKD